ncbi:hypothetical protein HAX54_029975 [Datura stramonium]|uniref:Cystatin domain-containing protein n=1 Tax=Datura stramonium TaxID=4076 RepID=A0ABS8SAJ8_DATST|nr:hypothetical protein [Datura stramonium]
MALKFNSIFSVTFSMIVVTFIFRYAFAANDNRKLLNSFGCTPSTPAPSPSHGDWQDIEDINDPKVVDIAKFAVNTQNSKFKYVQLEFGSVSEGRFRVDNNGITYDLTVDAVEFDELNEYEAVVFEINAFAGENYANLKTFRALSPTDPKGIKFAKLAINEYNKRTKTNVTFVKVIRAAETTTNDEINVALLVEGNINDDQSLSSNGDWQTIKNTNDPKVVDIAKFAVNTENHKLKSVELKFVSVLDGKFKVDNNGITYQLTIIVKEFNETHKCEAVVFENSKNNVRTLISFDQVAVIATTFCHANDNRKLLNSFEHVTNTLAPSPSDDGWQSIADNDDPKIEAIAEFAVNTKNNITKSNAYEFLEVSDGQFRYVNDGIIYSLYIVGAKLNELEEYTVVVYENTKNHVRKLISFT